MTRSISIKRKWGVPFENILNGGIAYWKEADPRPSTEEIAAAIKEAMISAADDLGIEAFDPEWSEGYVPEGVDLPEDDEFERILTEAAERAIEALDPS